MKKAGKGANEPFCDQDGGERKYIHQVQYRVVSRSGFAVTAVISYESFIMWVRYLMYYMNKKEEFKNEQDREVDV